MALTKANQPPLLAKADLIGCLSEPTVGLEPTECGLRIHFAWFCHVHLCPQRRLNSLVHGLVSSIPFTLGRSGWRRGWRSRRESNSVYSACLSFQMRCQDKRCLMVGRRIELSVPLTVFISYSPSDASHVGQLREMHGGSAGPLPERMLGVLAG